MDKFKIMFRHELRSRLPLPPKKGRQYDLFGVILMMLMVLFVCAVFITLLSAVISSYVLVKIDKVSDPTQRARELINVCYMAVLVALVIAGLENMRRSLTDRKHRELFLRLPLPSATIFLAKLAALLVSSYALAFVLIGTVSTVFYVSAPLGWTFLLRSVAVWLMMPLTAFLISTLLLVPYIKAVEFISDRYALMLLLVSVLVMGAFYVYSRFLGAVQTLIETGSIKYLFNERFVSTLQGLLRFGYPAGAYTAVALGGKLLPTLLTVLATIILAPLAAYLISGRLFSATIYKNDRPRRPVGTRVRRRAVSPLHSLIKKELICIYRDPKSAFSYLAVAASMPVMVYCCYTLFDSLIVGAIGMRVPFPLATLTVLIFSILTNTFCATNVSRDGAAAIKVKTYPVKASVILLAKVLLCAAVSSLSILVSVAVLAAFAGVTLTDALAVAFIALTFSLAQIFVATRMDLSAARLSSDLQQMRSTNSITVVKVVTLGLLLALVAGLSSVVAYVFSLGSSVSFIKELGFTVAHAYILPALVSALYLACAIAYYRIGIDKSLDGLSL